MGSGKNVSNNIIGLIDSIDLNSIDDQAEFIKVMNKLSNTVDHIKFKTSIHESSSGTDLVLSLEDYIDRTYINKQNWMEWEKEVHEAFSLQDHGMRAIALCKAYNTLNQLDHNDEMYEEEYEIQDSISGIR